MPTTLTPTPTPAPPVRLLSLDVFRGLTMAAMLIVNNPGSWAHVYPPLLHADWFGCTPTDLIFPFFLFAVGLSMPFSSRLSRAGGAGSAGRLASTYAAIIKRSAILIGLGLMLNAASVLIKDPVDFSTLRIPGVLQRIGLCYLLAAIILLHVPRIWQYLLGAGILVAYHFALTQIPVLSTLPGAVAAVVDSPAARLSPEGNLVAAIDRAVLTPAHMYAIKGVAHDPEGLLSTLPALVSTLMGCWTGVWLKRRAQRGATGVDIAARLAAVGGLGVLAGWLWSKAGLPVSKDLWTSSYVVLTAGWALLTLAVCWLVCERGHVWRPLHALALRPLQVMGVNAITAFVGSGLLARLLLYVTVPGGSGGGGGGGGAETVQLKRWLYERLLDTGLAPINASLAFALLTLSLWWAILMAMDRLGWRWRV